MTKGEMRAHIIASLDAMLADADEDTITCELSRDVNADDNNQPVLGRGRRLVVTTNGGCRS